MQSISKTWKEPIKNYETKPPFLEDIQAKATTSGKHKIKKQQNVKKYHILHGNAYHI